MIVKDFDDIEISTQTIIVSTNLNIDIYRLFNYLPITDYFVSVKKRGRHKKDIVEDPNKDIPDGSIITLKFQNESRGVDLKNKKKNGKKKFFRNALTVVMFIAGKKINFKISKKGKFQMTGCKKREYAEQSLIKIWEMIKDTDIYTFENGDILKAILFTVMTNIDFNVGFMINRENLDRYVNTHTDFNSLLETSFGYTGVNIKIKIDNLDDIVVRKLDFYPEGIRYTDISYLQYLDEISPEDKSKSLSKCRYTTFLVFHSGNIIMSSMEISIMKNIFHKFVKILSDCEDQIKEIISI